MVHVTSSLTALAPRLTGLENLLALQTLPTFQNERPVPDVVIASCHVIYNPNS